VGGWYRALLALALALALAVEGRAGAGAGTGEGVAAGCRYARMLVTFLGRVAVVSCEEENAEAGEGRVTEAVVTAAEEEGVVWVWVRAGAGERK
jgi:hypothetical protein